MSPRWLATADGMSPWPQAHVVVAGIGVSGFAAADGLLEFGARVTVLDDGADDARQDKATLLETLGATVRLGPGSTATLPADADLVITTGWPATAPLLVAGRGPRGPDLERGRAGLAAQPAGQDRPVARASPAPTARPPRPRCWSRC